METLGTYVLMLTLTSTSPNLNVVAVPGYTSREECAQQGRWYVNEAIRVGMKDAKFNCGPGPSVLPNIPDMLRGMIPR